MRYSAGKDAVRWCHLQRRSQDFFFGGGGHPVYFRHLSGSRPHSVGGGGVVADIFRDLNYRIGFSGGGGGSSRNFSR